jgi:hypothetical protein
VRTRSLILLALLVTLSGCIVTYRDFPVVNPLPSPYEPAAPPRCRHTVKFPGRLAEGGQWTYGNDWSGLSVDRGLQEALQHYAGCSSSLPVVHSSKWAETEVVVSVLVKPYTTYGGGMVGGMAPYNWPALLIPVYQQSGWELSYSFYDRNALKKTYKYEITVKEIY